MNDQRHMPDELSNHLWGGSDIDLFNRFIKIRQALIKELNEKEMWSTSDLKELLLKYLRVC